MSDASLKGIPQAYADGTITPLRKIVLEGLDSVTLEQIKKYVYASISHGDIETE